MISAAKPKPQRLRFLWWLALLPALAAPLVGHDLVPFGELPDAGKNWIFHQAGRQSGDLAWVVFRNAETGDLLSFAARKLIKGEGRDLLVFSDSTCEIFANGGEGPSPETKVPFSISPLRTKIVTLSLFNSTTRRDLSRKALEYTWVEEPDHGYATKMAHGYVLVFDELCLFVQHTSAKPITDEFVQQMAIQLISLRAARDVPGK